MDNSNSNNESVNFIGFKKTKRINTNTNFLDSIDKSCIKLSSMIIEKNYPLNYPQYIKKIIFLQGMIRKYLANKMRNKINVILFFCFLINFKFYL